MIYIFDYQHQLQYLYLYILIYVYTRTDSGYPKDTGVTLSFSLFSRLCFLVSSSLGNRDQSRAVDLGSFWSTKTSRGLECHTRTHIYVCFLRARCKRAYKHLRCISSWRTRKKNLTPTKSEALYTCLKTLPFLQTAIVNSHQRGRGQVWLSWGLLTHTTGWSLRKWGPSTLLQVSS